MNLDKQKKKLELMRVQMAKEELLFKIAERTEEIERLRQNITIQEEKEKQLKEEMGE